MAGLSNVMRATNRGRLLSTPPERRRLKAFYNSARDYFTGVVSPSVGVDLPPFYAAALLPRSAGSGALLIDGIDGKVQLAENGALKVVPERATGAAILLCCTRDAARGCR